MDAIPPDSNCLESKTSDQNDKKNEEYGSGDISVEVVMELLNAFKSKQENVYRLLQADVLKFVLTFWQRNHSVIEQLATKDEFWESLSYSLIESLKSSTDSDTSSMPKPTLVLAPVDELNSYALMILARGIFWYKSEHTERQMNPKLKDILEELSKKNFLEKYSASIKKKYSKITDNLDRGKDYQRILSAWCDFIASFSKFKPYEIGISTQNHLIEDILTCMLIELRLGEGLDRERIATLGEILLLIWTKWLQKGECPSSFFSSIHELLYLVDSVKDYLPFSFLLNFQSIINLYLVRQRGYLLKCKRSFDLLVPALQLMHFSIKIMEKHLNQQARVLGYEYKPGVESRLCFASIMTLRFIIDVSREDVSLWTEYLQTNLQTNALIQFLALLMGRRAGSELCLSLIELLLCLSSIKETAVYLNKAALVNEVNMIAMSAYETPYTHLSQLASTNFISSHNVATINVKIGTVQVNHQQRHTSNPMEVLVNNSSANQAGNNNPTLSDNTKIYLDNMNSGHNWLPIYRHVMRLNISMMLTLGGDFILTAIEFLSDHCIRICELLELLRTKPRLVNMEEALQTIYLISLVLRNVRMWKKKDLQSYQAISEEFGRTAYTLATSALPPPTTYQPEKNQQPYTSINPRDCLVYARCCYDFSKYTEAERVLFQTKFGDKNGFIKEASQIYGESLSKLAFHLAALICIKTNRQSDLIDFALQVFSDNAEHFDIIAALSQDRA